MNTANPALFSNRGVGRTPFKPLVKVEKDNNNNVVETPFKDVDYFELLGRKAIEMDEKNPNPRIPTNYGNYDRDTVNLAKEVVKGIDNGYSKEELNTFIHQCIILGE